MGCICSKGANEDIDINEIEIEKQKQNEFDKSSVQLVAPAPSKKEEDDFSRKDGSACRASKRNGGAAVVPLEGGGEKNTMIVERPLNVRHRRCATTDLGSTGHPNQQMGRIVAMPHGSEGELNAAGWPQWLTSAAGEAIKGWLPRRADSFEKLDKVSAYHKFSCSAKWNI